MRVRALDDNLDWTFGKGRNNYFLNNDAIIQNIGTRLRSFLGDCFFALDAGIDWFNLLGSKNQKELELAVRTTILNTEEVVGITDLSILLEENTRKINLNYTVNTVYTTALRIPPVVGLSTFLLTESGDVITTESGDPLSAV
jgi:hypothetical protein